MDPVTVRKVDTKKDFKDFLKLPWKIYKDDPYWVPPLLYDKKKILNKKKNPFFEHADMDMFIAEKNGEQAGRIAAIRNDLHNKEHRDKVGFFGFFECINDQEVANKLFDTCKEWLTSRGFNAMRGPANPSVNDEYGLLVEGFDDSPRIMMTYNPSYYINLIENYGFKKAKDLYAWKIQQEKLLKQEKIKRVADIAVKRYGLKIRSINMKNFNNELDKVKYVFNKAWQPNWGFVPFTENEIDAAAKDLKSLVDPTLVLFGEIENATVGFALVMPDYNFVFKKMDGKLFPFGIFKLLTQSKKIPWARIIILGIIPEQQKRGLDAAFYYEIVQRAAQRNIKLGEASWVLEDNEMMNKSAEAMAAEIYKRYRIYQIDI